MGTLLAQQSSEKPSTTEEIEKKVLEAIPVTEITSSADEALADLNKRLADAEPKSSITTIEDQLPKALDSLNTLRTNPILDQLGNLNVRILQNLSQEWTLYYWIPTHLFFKAKTEIALGVHDLIKAKGIDTPRPQRDVRMTVSDNQTAKQIIDGKVERKAAPRKKPGTKADSGEKV